jgi:hypothetical protein
MRKFFPNELNSWIVLPVFTLAMAWNFAQGAWLPAPSHQPLPGLANSVALGPTMPPPCCDVSENRAGGPVALGPTMPPPCCDVLEIIHTESAPSLAADPSSDFSEGSSVSRQIRAALRVTVPPQAGEDVRVI